MVGVLTLSINSFHGIKDVNIEVSKTMLYGPNGGGKSRTIYALMLMLHPRSVPKPYGEHLGDVDISIRFGGRTLRFSNWRYELDGVSGSYEYLSDQIRTFYKDVRSYALIKYNGAIVYGYIGEEPRELNAWYIGSLLEDPEEVERMEPHWTAFTSASRFYYGKVKVGDRWIDVDALSYGEKKAVALQYFAQYYDLVAIEGFEGGLHTDLAVELVDWLSRYSKYAIIETHHSTVLRKALDLGWKVYYVDKGVQEVTRTNISSIELFKRELMAYG